MELKKAKRNYYTKFFEDNSNNIKKTWKVWEGMGRYKINYKYKINKTIYNFSNQSKQ